MCQLTHFIDFPIILANPINPSFGKLKNRHSPEHSQIGVAQLYCIEQTIAKLTR